MAGFDKNAYDQGYKKEHFDNFGFYAPKGTKERLQAKAAQKGMSVSEYIRYLISQDLGDA